MDYMAAIMMLFYSIWNRSTLIILVHYLLWAFYGPTSSVTSPVTERCYSNIFVITSHIIWLILTNWLRIKFPLFRQCTSKQIHDRAHQALSGIELSCQAIINIKEDLDQKLIFVKPKTQATSLPYHRYWGNSEYHHHFHPMIGDLTSDLHTFPY